jgi:hypothetical protein
LNGLGLYDLLSKDAADHLMAIGYASKQTGGLILSSEVEVLEHVEQVSVKYIGNGQILINSAIKRKDKQQYIDRVLVKMAQSA